MSEAFDDAMSAEEARLLDRLGRALGVDQAPEGLVGRAEGLLAFADVDRELAELQESAAAEPVGVRGSAAAVGEPLVFQVADGSVGVELTFAGDRLHGQVLAGVPSEVALEYLTGAVLVGRVDELGRFSFETPATGAARLQLRGGSTRFVFTDWFLL